MTKPTYPLVTREGVDFFHALETTVSLQLAVNQVMKNAVKMYLFLAHEGKQMTPLLDCYIEILVI